MKLGESASLVVVGSGIKFLAHMTTEVRSYIQQSDRVFYLVNEVAIENWIQTNNKMTESLDNFYGKYSQREDCYKAMAEYVLEHVRSNQHVCFVIYGHPTFFAKPALEAVLIARSEGYYAKILPGVSSEDCLFADLAINPGSNGYQCYEATDFLIYPRQIDTSCHVVLYQMGFIGALGYPKFHNNEHGIKLLTEKLSHLYDVSHEIILYESAQYSHLEPRIDRLTLKSLPSARLTLISTLYIPPYKKLFCDENIVNILFMHTKK